MAFYRDRLRKATYVCDFDDASCVVDVDMGTETRLSATGTELVTTRATQQALVKHTDIEPDSLGEFLYFINNLFKKPSK